MIAAIHLSLGQVAVALAIATIRSFVQLTAIGYVIKLIFEQNKLIFVFALIAAMVLFGALTARSRARRVPHAFCRYLSRSRSPRSPRSRWSSRSVSSKPRPATSSPSAAW